MILIQSLSNKSNVLLQIDLFQLFPGPVEFAVGEGDDVLILVESESYFLRFLIPWLIGRPAIGVVRDLLSKQSFPGYNP